MTVPVPDITLESWNSSQATLSGYTYFIPSLQRWIPVEPTQLAYLAYSLHIFPDLSDLVRSEDFGDDFL
jgi:hypothetical protein